jgi:Stage II sporulation protein E (SpoIIE)
MKTPAQGAVNLASSPQVEGVTRPVLRQPQAQDLRQGRPRHRCHGSPMAGQLRPRRPDRNRIAPPDIQLADIQLADIQLADVRFRLAPGDTLLLYTDGATEAREQLSSLEAAPPAVRRGRPGVSPVHQGRRPLRATARAWHQIAQGPLHLRNCSFRAAALPSGRSGHVIAASTKPFWKPTPCSPTWVTMPDWSSRRPGTWLARDEGGSAGEPHGGRRRDPEHVGIFLQAPADVVAAGYCPAADPGARASPGAGRPAP